MFSFNSFSHYKKSCVNDPGEFVITQRAAKERIENQGSKMPLLEGLEQSKASLHVSLLNSASDVAEVADLARYISRADKTFDHGTEREIRIALKKKDTDQKSMLLQHLSEYPDTLIKKIANGLMAEQDNPNLAD